MADPLSFSLVQLQTNITPATSPNEIDVTEVGTTTGVQNRALIAISGDGDGALEAGESGYILAGARASNGVTGIGLLGSGLNTTADPVSISVHGRINSTTVGTLNPDTALGFGTRGFGVDNGPDTTNGALNGGDSITWKLNPVGSVAQQLTTVSFIVDRAGTGTTEVAFDFDGNVVRSGAYGAAQNGANANAALRLTAVPNGATVEIDFVGHSILVGGVARTGASVTSFFTAYEASPKDTITIGGIGPNSFAVSGLSLGRVDAGGVPTNRPASVSLTNVLATLPEDTDTAVALKIADIAIIDDGRGQNVLSLAGADAALFQIVGNSLMLRAGVVLDFETNRQLDVQVRVDDATITGTPDGNTTLAVAVTDAAETDPTQISFAYVQLKTGVTPASADSNPITTFDIGTTTTTANRAFVALRGNGDAALETGETGYILAGARASNGVTGSGTLNTAGDPVSISVHGRASSTAVGALGVDTALGFSARGFGVDNGPDSNNATLNSGDSVTFRLNPLGGDAQKLTSVSFVVDRAGAIGTTEVAFDFDGDVLQTGSYGSTANAANRDVALRLASVPGGATVVVDFVAGTISVNGTLRSDPSIAGFFAAFEASGRDTITIGNVTTTGFAVKNLSLNHADNTAPSNLPPRDLTLTPIAASLAENVDTTQRVKVADVAVIDDGRGSHTLQVTGADAALFEVDATGLYLKAGVVLDAETRTQLSVTVQVDDPTVGASPDVSKAFVLPIGDVNEFAIGAVTDANTADNAIPQNAAAGTSVGITVAATDADRSNNAITYSLEQNPTGRFAIDATSGEITVVGSGSIPAGVQNVTVRATSADGSSSTSDFQITVGAVHPKYGDITLDGTLGDWGAGTVIHTSGTNEVRASYQAGAFVLALDTGTTPIGPNTTLWFDTDRNAATGFKVFGWAVGAEFNINFGADGRPALYTGNTGDLGGTFVANLDYGLSADGTRLEIALPSSLAGGATLANLYLDVNNDYYLPGAYADGGFRIGQNQAPALELTGMLAALRENADTAQPIKVADIAIQDPDGLGTNALSLTGADAGLFEITNGGLYIKAGAALDFEENSALDVNVLVNDPSVGNTPDDTAGFHLNLGDVREVWGGIRLDGTLSTNEWAANTRLDTVTNGTAGYAVRGTFDADAFLISIDTPDSVKIGANTTIWLNTDLNASSGYQVFGNTVGAEYNVNFRADGTAALYTGAAGQNLVADNLDYFLSADRTTLEIALPSNLLGNSRRADVFFDINDSPFLPNSYASGGYRIEEKTIVPSDPKLRVAIVYSEASADAYFNKTAYGQLFMAAQNQARQAGVPYDVISEADLTNIANLTKYDAIVFPGLSHVQSGRLTAITETLTSASKDYGIGLVAMGNFLTNVQGGGEAPGGAYSRMQALLGIESEFAGATGNVTLRAATTTHPVSDEYGANELVATYTNTSYAAYRALGGVDADTLFTQGVAGTVKPAVIATNFGGHNVHFASDALFGNNNILQDAISWAARGDAPEIELEMTRGSSLFFSRNDMDQSQEAFDVIEPANNIYDAMLPIVQDWYQQYNFVGSYYVNVGIDAPDQRTDWNISKPYYQQLMAMENEIGTHSYSHPHDTNFLLKDDFTQAQWSAWLTNAEMSSSLRTQLNTFGAAATKTRMEQLLTATNPSSANPTDPTTYNQMDREILKASYKFQFDYSAKIIAAQLGLSNVGGAVPGMPEQLAATLEMLPYLSYLTGGYSGIGAGYPGAFGFLDPGHKDQVYFAPNMSFDFTWIGFQGLTAAEATQKWLAEYDKIVAHGNAPIIHFPWHDYGVTNWPSEGAPNPGYTRAMFEAVLERAYADGTEFVTGADLAERIKSFAETDIQISGSGNNLVAAVTGSDTGKFALEVDTSQSIANVGNWYAFDGKKVFIDRNGGTFNITLGTQADDVTRIAKLPMRAELISVNGDGTDLSFSVEGKGAVVVDLEAPNGRAYTVTGIAADKISVNGQLMTLAFDTLGVHNVSIDLQGNASAMAARSGADPLLPQTVLGTVDNDFIRAASSGSRIDGGHGEDTLVGGGGDDLFVFRHGDGADRVVGFELDGDRVELIDSGFASEAEAIASFRQGEAGVVIELSDTDHLLIRDINLADLDKTHLILTDSLTV